MNLTVRTKRLFGFAALSLVLLLGACSSSEERAQAYYKSGTEYVAKGELEKASLEFRNALKLNQDYN